MDRGFVAQMAMRVGAPTLIVIIAVACASTARQRDTVHLAEKDTAALPIVVRQTDSAGISGIVRSPHGWPVRSVHVALLGRHTEALGDSLGRFSMKLAPGSYTLVTDRIGYFARRDSIRVPSEGGLYLEIPLLEKPLRLDATCHRLPSGDVIC